MFEKKIWALFASEMDNFVGLKFGETEFFRDG